MSSVATEEPEPRYLYVRALVDDDGSLRWEYQLPGRPAVSMAHDENVGEWKERERLWISLGICCRCSPMKR